MNNNMYSYEDINATNVANNINISNNIVKKSIKHKKSSTSRKKIHIFSFSYNIRSKCETVCIENENLIM